MGKPWRSQKRYSLISVEIWCLVFSRNFDDAIPAAVDESCIRLFVYIRIQFFSRLVNHFSSIHPSIHSFICSIICSFVFFVCLFVHSSIFSLIYFKNSSQGSKTCADCADSWTFLFNEEISNFRRRGGNFKTPSHGKCKIMFVQTTTQIGTNSNFQRWM